jgi:hypothetical protein
MLLNQSAHEMRSTRIAAIKWTALRKINFDTRAINLAVIGVPIRLTHVTSTWSIAV